MNTERMARHGIGNSTVAPTKPQLEMQQHQHGCGPEDENDDEKVPNKEEELVCQACAIEAMFVHQEMRPCPKCNLVFYCSEECRDWDWTSGGHKANCKISSSEHSVVGNFSHTSLSQGSLDAGHLFGGDTSVDLAPEPSPPVESAAASNTETPPADDPTLASYLQGLGDDRLSSVMLRPDTNNETEDESLSMDILNENYVEQLNIISEESFVSDGPVTEASWRRKTPFMKVASSSKVGFQANTETVVEEAEEDTEEVAEGQPLLELIDSKSFGDSDEEVEPSEPGNGSGGPVGDDESLGDLSCSEQRNSETHASGSNPQLSDSSKSQLRVFREVYNSSDIAMEDERGIPRTLSASSLKSFREAYNQDRDDLSIASTSEHSTRCSPKRRSFLDPNGSDGEEEEEDSFARLGFDHPDDAPIESTPSETVEGDNTNSISRARQRVVQSQATLKSKLVGFEQKFGEKAAIEALDGLKDQVADPQQTKAELSIRVERGREHSEHGITSESSEKVLHESISVDFLTSSPHRGSQRRFSSTQNCSIKSVQDESISIDFLATMTEKNGFRNGPIPQYMQYRQSLAKHTAATAKSQQNGSSLNMESSVHTVKDEGSVDLSSRMEDSKPNYISYRSSLSKQASSKSSLDEGQKSGSFSYSECKEPRNYDRYRKSLSTSHQVETKEKPHLHSQDGAKVSSSALPQTDGARPEPHTNDRGYVAYRRSLSRRSAGGQEETVEKSEVVSLSPIGASFPCSAPSSEEGFVSGNVTPNSGYMAYRRSLSQRSEATVERPDRSTSSDADKAAAGYMEYRRSLSYRSDQNNDPTGGFEDDAIDNKTEEKQTACLTADQDQGVDQSCPRSVEPDLTTSYVAYRRSLSKQSIGEQSDRSDAGLNPVKTSPRKNLRPTDSQSTNADTGYIAYRRSLSQSRPSNDGPCDSSVSDPFAASRSVEGIDLDEQSEIPPKVTAHFEVSEAASDTLLESAISGEGSTKTSLYGSYRSSLSARSRGPEPKPSQDMPAASPSMHTGYEVYRRSLSCRSTSSSLEMGVTCNSNSEGHSAHRSEDVTELEAPQHVEKDVSCVNPSRYGEYRRSLSLRSQQEEKEDPSAAQSEQVLSVEETIGAKAKPFNYEEYSKKLSVQNQTEATKPLESALDHSHEPDGTKAKPSGYAAYRQSLSERSQPAHPVDANFHDAEHLAIEQAEETNVLASSPTSAGYGEYRTSLSKSNDVTGDDIDSEPIHAPTHTDTNTEPSLPKTYASYRQALSQNKSCTEKNEIQTEQSPRSSSPFPNALKAGVAEITCHETSQSSQSHDIRSANQSFLSPHRIVGAQVMTTAASLQVQSPGSRSSPRPIQITSPPEQSTSSVTSNSENPAVAATKPKYAHMSRYLNYRLGLEPQDEETAAANPGVGSSSMSKAPSDTADVEQAPAVQTTPEDAVSDQPTNGVSLPPNVEWGSTDASALFEVWQEVESDRSKMHSRLEQKRVQPTPKKTSFQLPQSTENERPTRPKPKPTLDIEEGVEPEKRLAMIEDEHRNNNRSHQALLCCRYLLFLLLLIVLPSIIGVLVRSAKRQPIPQPLENQAAFNSPSSGPAPSSNKTSTPTLNTVLTPTSLPTMAPVESLLPAEASRIEETVLDILVELDNQVALRTPGTPQFLSYMWLLSDHEILQKFSRGRIVQRYALATLYHSTDGENWFNDENWLSKDDECTWYSISVNPDGPCNADGFMTSMDLSFNDLSGRLPPEIGLLTRLERLSLMGQNNEKTISGVLPSSMGNMKSLVYLNVRGNALVGPLPSELGNLDRLEVLDLGMNKFALPLPPQLGNLSSLRVLNLELNRLTGTLPTEVNLLVRLEQLMLGSNYLTGALAITGSLTALRVLNLEQNRFTSVSFEGAQLPSLETLTLYENDLAGRMPQELGDFTALRRLSLHSNNLQGPIRTELGQLQQLEELNVAYNRLTGDIPTELGALVGLKQLELQTNRLAGNIPVTLQHLSNLSIIRLDDNEFSGAVPAEVCDSFESFSPTFYVDCGAGQRGRAEVACAPNSCCSFCCVDGAGCQCAFDEGNEAMCFNNS